MFFSPKNRRFSQWLMVFSADPILVAILKLFGQVWLSPLRKQAIIIKRVILGEIYIFRDSVMPVVSGNRAAIRRAAIR